MYNNIIKLFTIIKLELDVPDCQKLLNCRSSGFNIGVIVIQISIVIDIILTIHLSNRILMTSDLA